MFIQSSDKREDNSIIDAARICVFNKGGVPIDIICTIDMWLESAYAQWKYESQEIRDKDYDYLKDIVRVRDISEYRSMICAQDLTRENQLKRMTELIEEHIESE